MEKWTLEGDSIKREWIFQDFSEAMDFLNMVAVIVEKHNHHPEIHNVYNKVTLWLSTHDAGGITEKDIKIAKEINKIRLDFYYFYRFSSNLNIS